MKDKMKVFRLLQEFRSLEEETDQAEARAHALAYQKKCSGARVHDVLNKLQGKVLLHAGQDQTWAYWLDERGDVVASAPCVYSHEIDRAEG